MWLEAGLWGLVGGSALVLGAVIAFVAPLPQRRDRRRDGGRSGRADLRRRVRSDGRGVQAGRVRRHRARVPRRRASPIPSPTSIISRRGAQASQAFGQRTARQPPADQPDGGTPASPSRSARCSTAFPESVVIGVSLLAGGGVSPVTVAAVFLSNVPEGLSSAAGMKKAGRSAALHLRRLGRHRACVRRRGGVRQPAARGRGAGRRSPRVTAVAAGAILAMLVDTMIPEATEATHDIRG